MLESGWPHESPSHLLGGLTFPCVLQIPGCVLADPEMFHMLASGPPQLSTAFSPGGTFYCVCVAYMGGFSSFRAIAGNFLSARAARVDNHLGMGLSEFLGHFGATFWDTFWLLSIWGDLSDRA